MTLSQRFRLLAAALAVSGICLSGLSDHRHIVAAEGPILPVYPNSTLTAMSPVFGNTINAVFSSGDACEEIVHWYEDRLPAAGWTVTSSEGDEDYAYWSIEGEHTSSSFTATIDFDATMPGGSTSIFANVMGPGVSADVFGDAGNDTAAPPDVNEADFTDPNSPEGRYAAAMQDFESPIEMVLQALEAFVDMPSPQTILQVTSAVDAYMAASDAVIGFAQTDEEENRNPFSGLVCVQNIELDMYVGQAVYWVEEAERDSSLTDLAVENVRRYVTYIRESLLRKLQAVMIGARKFNETTQMQEQGMTPTQSMPLTTEFCVEAGEPPFEPSTKLTVKRIFTPRERFWNDRLKDTFIHLRNWNAGCPEGDQTTDTGLICKAFGFIPSDEPPGGKRCLGIERTEENEKQVLSDPLDVYCLAALAIEVGDPAQITRGGSLRVYIDDEYFMTVPLQADSLEHSSFNPWDIEGTSKSVAEIGDVTAAARPFLNGIRAVYGDDAAEHYKVGYRNCWVVTEATGGEYNGYVLYLHIGNQLVDPWNEIILVSPATEDWITVLPMRLLRIARSNHPALESKHKIKIETSVGDYAAQPIEFEIEAPFDQLARQAGTWNGWPGGEPEEWTFGQELGAQPEIGNRPVYQLNESTLVAMIEDSKKLARTCQLYILEPWIKMLANSAIEAVVDRALLTKENKGKLKQMFDDTLGGIKSKQLMTSAMNKLVDYIEKRAQDYGHEFIDSQLGDLIKEAGGKAIDAALGTWVFTKADEIKKGIVVGDDPTYKIMKQAARNNINHYRIKMWDIADQGRKEMDLINWLDDPFKQGIEDVTGVVGEKTMKATGAELFFKTFRYTLYGLEALDNLVCIIEIERELSRIKNVVETPTAWVMVNSNDWQVVYKQQPKTGRTKSLSE